MVQMRPVPVKAFLNLEVTKACCLECDFCLAAGKNKGPKNISLELARSTLEQFHGADRVVLLGGEPLMHPEIEKIIEAVSNIGAKTEIYTNGFLLGDSKEKVKRSCIQIGTKNPHGTIFTLAVDSSHAVQLGHERLGAILDGVLSVQRQIPNIHVRFNITDGRIGTSNYLSPNLVLEILSEIHPYLVSEFKASVSNGDTWKKFLFNSVVRMGRAQERAYLISHDMAPEFIRASDLAKGVELTAVMENEQGMGIYSWLNAMWMDNCSQAFLVTRIERGQNKLSTRAKVKMDFRQWLARNVYGLADGIFGDSDRDTIMRWLLGDDDDTGSLAATMERLCVDHTCLERAMELLRAHEAGADLQSLKVSFSNALISLHRWRLLDGWYQGETSKRITKPILDYLLEDDGPPLDLSSFFRFCPFPLEALVELVGAYHQKFPERIGYLVNQLLNDLVEHTTQVPVVYDTSMAQWADFPVEVSNSMIDTGVCVLDNLRKVRLLVAHLLALPGKGFQLKFPGLDFKPGSLHDAAAGWTKILDLMAVVLPQRSRVLFSSVFCKHPTFSGLPALVQERLRRWSKGLKDELPPQDPIRVFESLNYEPNSDYIPWDDTILASLIEELGLRDWTQEQVKTLLNRFEKGVQTQ